MFNVNCKVLQLGQATGFHRSAIAKLQCPLYNLQLPHRAFRSRHIAPDGAGVGNSCAVEQSDTNDRK
ncbi:hypothetical protein RB5110 [Rhodopirellula baltica SH 1]|uniref:Uncharacterized protein n=1 Tax=Rhodopirellula baltica (strain DSM 10527 / NCIMB 13988 / SH1) TaxID=243090 RepID=Q7UGN5_RHOBA|nr:hypothetical protein RB5110 [Rhodopirellula baltica SH 1]